MGCQTWARLKCRRSAATVLVRASTDQEGSSSVSPFADVNKTTRLLGSDSASSPYTFGSNGAVSVQGAAIRRPHGSRTYAYPALGVPSASAFRIVMSTGSARAPAGISRARPACAEPGRHGDRSSGGADARCREYRWIGRHRRRHAAAAAPASRGGTDAKRHQHQSKGPRNSERPSSSPPPGTRDRVSWSP